MCFLILIMFTQILGFLSFVKIVQTYKQIANKIKTLQTISEIL